MKNRLISAAMLMTVAMGCKPKGSDSGLESITGLTADGKEAALSLIPVRNFSPAALGDKSADAGVKQAGAMVKTRLFALVECVAAKHKRTGKTISATDLMAAVELRAAIDDLYVDQNRTLLTSASDSALADFGSTNKLVTVPCHIHGERLLSWPVITDLQLRAAGLPKSLPTASAAKAATMATYSLMQAVHQSFRGSFTEDASKDFMPRVPAMIDMIQEQAGGQAEASNLIARIKGADKYFNACSKQSTSATPVPYAASLRTKAYACTPESGRAGMFSYRAGGNAGKGYETVKSLLAAEIVSAHASVFARSSNDDAALFGLWDLLTSTQKWSTYTGSSRDLGNYLVTGKGFDFDARFASHAAGAVAAPSSLSDLASSHYEVSPLAVAVPSAMLKAGKRDQFIQRASSAAGSRGLFVGGARSSADGRGASATDRLRGVGSQMGASGSVQLKSLEASVADSMALIRD